MNYDAQLYPYPSRRSVIHATEGMVATTSPLAAQAGLRVLQKGGNAIDAAIASAACLTVVEPTSNGLGGDAFALVWVDGKLHGLNASGPAPAVLHADTLRAQGHTEVPRYGWPAVMVPGQPAAWAAMSRRFGRLPFSDLFLSAAAYAANGFPVGVTVARLWERAWKLYRHTLQGDLYRHWFDQFSVNGTSPQAGSLWHSEQTAHTLEEIGSSNADSVYSGNLAERMLAFSKESGGYLTRDDLASYQPQWVDPLSVNYHGFDIWELPPNGHGISVLMALNILDGLQLSPLREDARNYHLQIEAMKLAFCDCKRYVTDPNHMSVTAEQLLSKSYADERRKLIGDRALLPAPGSPWCGGTVYLCTADSQGNMVSYIQSNYNGFGSGLVVPGTGIALNNRGAGFSLQPGHANELMGGKRPYNTIIPGFITQKNRPLGPFGVMGAFMQPQGHLQMMCNVIDFHLNPQAALDAPRWQWTGERQIQIEHDVPQAVAQQLVERGHEVTITTDNLTMGRGQIIHRLENGVYCGGTEPRADGAIAAY